MHRYARKGALEIWYDRIEAVCYNQLDVYKSEVPGPPFAVGDLLSQRKI